MEVDLYGLLGLKKSATLDEVRRAYRKLAIKLHPDRNPDPAVALSFKQISSAYEILSNEEKRRKYDEILRAPPKPPPNYPVADVSIQVEVDAKDILHGGDKTVTVSRPRSCPDCRGGGRLSRNRQRCALCEGHGCAPCEWTGRLVHCGRCWGTGSDRELATLVVRVPPGTAPYGRQKFVAYGDLWGKKGPFYVVANVTPRVKKPGLIMR